MRQFTITPPFGLNNVDTAYKAPKVQFDGDNINLTGELLSCSNYRLLKDGSIKTRNGMTKKVTPTAGRSWWTDLSGTIGFYTDGVNLVKVASDYSVSNIYTSLTAGLDMRFTEYKPLDAGYSQGRLIFMGDKKKMLKYGGGTSAAGWGIATNISEEFEYPQLRYIGPPVSNIFISYYARMYVASGRFLYYSEILEPEKFRNANMIPCDEEITSISKDYNNLYVHTLNKTKVLTGRDPSDFMETISHIGFIKQRMICPHEFEVPYPMGMTRLGWARAVDGRIEYIDDNFRLDLPSTAVAYTGYNKVNREVLCSIRQ